MADQARTQVAVAPKDIQHQRSWLTLILKALVAVITAPYRRTFKLYTWAPISAIRAAGGDRKALIPLARDFKVDKYAELQSVQVAVSALALRTTAFTSLSFAPLLPPSAGSLLLHASS